jgi:hypothetical protein
LLKNEKICNALPSGSGSLRLNNHEWQQYLSKSFSTDSSDGQC